ncbi:MAG: hypothetical protein J0L92_23280 [Deltaproteobacteria bacterium]|nr:hypothetical protein [Deltaproteobacteria bacterium]
MITDIECDGDTPYCDARVGECVANACGDGVIHDNEVCEEGDDLCWLCRRACTIGLPCLEDEACVPLADSTGFERGACTPLDVDRAPDGTPCERGDECRSTYCDRIMGRCTSVTEPEVCNGPGSRTGNDIFFDVGPSIRFPHVCVYSCLHQHECGEGALCRLGVIQPWPLRHLIAVCSVPGAIGTAAFADACVRDSDCQSLMCVGGRCTAVCRDEADCGGVLPACVGVDLSAERFVTARPDDWPTPWPLLCAP